MPTTLVDPYRNFDFRVEIQGVIQAGFSFAEVSGFGASVEIVEHREGGTAKSMRKLPGKTTYPNIVLKRGLTQDSELWDWFQDVINGKIVRQSGAIIVIDYDGTDAVRWNFTQGWPTKMTGPDLNAKGNDVAIDTLEIAHEGLERVAKK
jgi:phage tail-like protein